MSTRNRSEPVVITYTELTVMLILVTALFVLFFPGDRIRSGIASEKSNYDLTLVYLRSIAHAYPDDPENWMRLLDAELTMGDTASAEKTFAQLKHFKKIDRKELVWFGYKLLKTRYLHSVDPYRKAQLRLLLRTKLRDFVRSDDPSLWLIALQEARELQMPQLQFDAMARRINHTDLTDTYEVARFLQLAVETNSVSEAVKRIETLLYKNADPRFYELLKKFYLAREAYAPAAALARRWFLQSGEREAFLDAVRFAFWAKQKDQARSMIEKHAMRFLDDPATSQQIIKLLLANGMPEEAHRFTVALLKHQRIVP